MVNTFLISADFDECAKALDNRRLGKQRVEAYQILKAIRGETKGWNNHPATNMWRPYSGALILYMNSMINEFERRGFNNNMVKLKANIILRPKWLNWKSLHLSHKCSLLRKDYDHYSKIFILTEEEKIYMNYGYVWPAKLNLKTYLYPPEEICEKLVIWSKEEVKRYIETGKNPRTGRTIKSDGLIAKSILKFS